MLNSIEAMQLLVSCNANLEAMDVDNETPPYTATIYNSSEAKQLLLNHNAETAPTGVLKKRCS